MICRLARKTNYERSLYLFINKEMVLCLKNKRGYMQISRKRPRFFACNLFITDLLKLIDMIFLLRRNNLFKAQYH